MKKKKSVCVIPRVLSPSLSHTHTLFLSFALSLFLSFSLSLSFSFSFSFSLSHFLSLKQKHPAQYTTLLNKYSLKSKNKGKEEDSRLLLALKRRREGRKRGKEEREW